MHVCIPFRRWFCRQSGVFITMLKKHWNTRGEKQPSFSFSFTHLIFIYWGTGSECTQKIIFVDFFISPLKKIFFWMLQDSKDNPKITISKDNHYSSVINIKWELILFLHTYMSTWIMFLSFMILIWNNINISYEKCDYNVFENDKPYNVIILRS